MRHTTAALALLLTNVACDKKEVVTPDPAPAEQGVATNEAEAPDEPAVEAAPPAVEVVPLQHASLLLKWDGLVIAVDPVKDALEAAPGDEPQADLILLTDIHGDHLDAESVANLRKEGAPVVAPQAVVDEAGAALPNPTVLANGEKRQVLDGRVGIEAMPMYNLVRKREDSGEPYHVKGRGNGYILTLGEQRVYLSGDTECIPEMKALEDIDVALVCMNLPYTMTVEEAAECVSAFEPHVLYPYHFRDQDPARLNELLAGKDVEVKLLDWYPGSQ